MEKITKKKAKLIALTNKFLEEFSVLSSESEDDEKTERDDLYAFHFILPRIIAKSNYPRYKEKDSCLFAMSSFDTEIAKELFNERIQGFVATIEEVIESGRNDDDYRISDVKKENKKVTVDDFIIERGASMNFKLGKKVIDSQIISFGLQNSRNSFKGTVKITKEDSEKIVMDAHGVEALEKGMFTKKVEFFNSSKERVMTIDFDFHNNERGTIHHFKHVADINSFYILLNCI